MNKRLKKSHVQFEDTRERIFPGHNVDMVYCIWDRICDSIHNFYIALMHDLGNLVNFTRSVDFFKNEEAANLAS